jgi:hypothetical protein
MRPWRFLVAAALMLGACSSAAVTTTTVPVATPPPTTVDVATTLAVRYLTNRLESVDPVTLEPVPGVVPLPSTTWFDWRLSPNQRWLALVAYDVMGFGGDLRLVDLDAWQQIDTDLSRNPVAIVVDDAGTMTWTEWVEGSPPALYRLPLGSSDVEMVAALPEAFTGPEMHQYEGGFALFGLMGDAAGLYQGSASIVTVDSTGSVVEIGLPDVTIGLTSMVDDERIGPIYEETNPSVVWDGDRALVIHADQPAVTEVDLISGDTETHVIGAEGSALDAFLRWLIPPAQAKLSSGDSVAGVISPDGTRLYVASSRSDVFKDGDGAWNNVITPLGIDVIDTAAWRTVGRIDLPVDSLRVSADGTTLLAFGYRTDWVEGGDWQNEWSPLYVIDAASLEVTHEVDVSMNPGMEFTADPGYAYVTNWQDPVVVRVLDLASGEFVASRQATTLVVIPSVSVLGVAGD